METQFNVGDIVVRKYAYKNDAWWKNQDKHDDKIWKVIETGYKNIVISDGKLKIVPSFNSMELKIKETNMKTDKEKYLDIYNAMMAAMDLKVGDTVKIERGLPVGVDRPEFLGWDACWNSNMDTYIGKEICITGFNNMDGYVIGEYSWPIFVLSKVEKKLPNPIELSSGDYYVKFNKDKSIDVGCQHIEFPLLEKIYNTAKDIQS